MKTVALLSGKGGVGKTSISILLAKALLRRGFKTGLLDLDFTPSVPVMLKMNPHGLLVVEDDRVKPFTASDGLKVWSLGFLLPSQDQPIMWRGEMKRNIVRSVGNINWGNIDYLVVDCPPGTTDEITSMALTLNPTGSIIVTTPHPAAALAGLKAIRTMQRYKVPIIGVIYNWLPQADWQPQIGGPFSDVPILGCIPQSQYIYDGNFDLPYSFMEAVATATINFQPPPKQGKSIKRRIMEKLL